LDYKSAKKQTGAVIKKKRDNEKQENGPGGEND
jgi:hypothetical protein